jgi:hypothetical protein
LFRRHADTRRARGSLSKIGDLPRDPELYPIVQSGHRALATIVAEMAVVRHKLLTEAVANLFAERDRIIRALDFLFTGS